MSEDEIMKDIDNYISFANKAENFSDINEYLHCKELARRMKGLLDLYQKEKAKAEEYRIGWCNTGEELEQEKEKNKELEDITRAYNGMKGIMPEGNPIVIADKEYFDSGRFVERYISKDKIREKIEEVKRKREEEWETAGISMLGSAIDVLKELLEEE